MITVDLFSGCGGMSLGFSNEGFNVKRAYDSWDKAIECYNFNFDHEAVQFDLSNVEEAVLDIKRFNPEIIIGGPPCQDFSHAGKRIEGTRADMTLAYSNIISSIRPKWFVMENVDRAMKSQAYSVAREIFKEAGYGLTEKVVDASKCGVPQKRRRFFCIGRLNSPDGFLDDAIESNLSDERMTVRDYFGDSLGVEHYYRHPRNYNRRGVFSIDEPAPTIRGVNRPIPDGYPGHKNDPVKITKKVRALTTEERALIQTFPEGFLFKSSKTHNEQMIGNAVPVKLAEFIAKIIKSYEGGVVDDQ